MLKSIFEISIKEIEEDEFEDGNGKYKQNKIPLHSNFTFSPSLLHLV